MAARGLGSWLRGLRPQGSQHDPNAWYYYGLKYATILFAMFGCGQVAISVFGPPMRTMGRKPRSDS